MSHDPRVCSASIVQSDLGELISVTNFAFMGWIRCSEVVTTRPQCWFLFGAWTPRWLDLITRHMHVFAFLNITCLCINIKYDFKRTWDNIRIINTNYHDFISNLFFIGSVEILYYTISGNFLKSYTSMSLSKHLLPIIVIAQFLCRLLWIKYMNITYIFMYSHVLHGAGTI